MKIIECHNQSELDAALKHKDVEIWLKGDKSFEVHDSSTVTACDSSTVTACDSSTVRASKYSAIHILSKASKVKGGVQIRPKRPQKVKAAALRAAGREPVPHETQQKLNKGVR